MGDCEHGRHVVAGRPVERHGLDGRLLVRFVMGHDDLVVGGLVRSHLGRASLGR